MPKQLLESDFLTVNLGSVLRTQKAFDAYDPSVKNTVHKTDQERDLKQISDWGKELKGRLAENNQQPSDLRESDYDIEAKFFEDYFNYGDSAWDAYCAEQLLGFGAPLKKAIKVLGFDKNINPILGFLTDDTVIRNLIQTKLLNINTFKAIYTAVAKKLVANSEFFTSNDYNIIYCQDLYKKPVAEMLKYLELQSRILKTSTSAYTVADQEKNKKIFFHLEAIKELDIEKRAAAIKSLPASTILPNAYDPDTVLNSLNLANTLSGRANTNNNNVSNKKTGKKTSSATATAGKLGSEPAQLFAAIQYLGMTTDAPEVNRALQHEAFKSISTDKLITAMGEVLPIMKQAQLQDDDVKSFIDQLLGRLDRNY
jgi:hypothetical protein